MFALVSDVSLKSDCVVSAQTAQFLRLTLMDLGEDSKGRDWAPTERVSTCFKRVYSDWFFHWNSFMTSLMTRTEPDFREIIELQTDLYILYNTFNY